MPTSVIPVTGALEQPVGAISQTDFPLISPRLVETTDTLNIGFGDPFVLNPDNTYSSVASYISKNSVAAFLAFLASLPTFAIGIAKDTVEANAYYPLNGGTAMPAGTYLPGMICNGLTRGTINIAVNNGTPVGANSPVYIRTTVNGAIPLGVVGGFEAVPDGTIAGAAVAGNTGNGTIGTLSVLGSGVNGVYTLKYTSATAFTVYNPAGDIIGTGVNGTPFNTGGQIQFTMTAGGTAFVAGDSFTVTTALKTVAIPNIVFKTGLLSTDPVSGQITAQATILERKVA